MNFWKNPEYHSLKVLIIVIAVFGIGAFALFAMRQTSLDQSGRVYEQKVTTRTPYNIKTDTAGVSKLQEYLQTKGYYTGMINGTFDKATSEAISLWQKEIGIIPTGLISKDWKPADPKMMPPEDETFTACDVDFDGNGVINVNDLLIFFQVFGTQPEDSVPQDIDDNGIVNISDLLIFIQFFTQVTGDCTESCELHDIWTQKADFGGYPNGWHPSFATTSKGYMGRFAPDFYEYDPVTDVWTLHSNSPQNFEWGAVTFSINDNSFVGIGSGSNNFYAYNTDTDLWTQKASYPGGANALAFGVSIGNKGYVGTGWGPGAGPGIFYKDFWEYDSVSDTWTQKADFPGAGRVTASGFAIGGKVYVGVGYNQSNNFKDFWEYNPATDTWTQKADFGGGERAVAVGFSIGSKGYIGTGQKTIDSQNGITINFKDFWEYNPATDTWTQKADFGGGERYVAAGFSIDGKGYIGTGVSPGVVHKDFWEYCP